jgi:hypothetical protein
VAAILANPGQTEPYGMTVMNLDSTALAVPQFIITGGIDDRGVASSTLPAESGKFFSDFLRFTTPSQFFQRNCPISIGENESRRQFHGPLVHASGLIVLSRHQKRFSKIVVR